MMRKEILLYSNSKSVSTTFLQPQFIFPFSSQLYSKFSLNPLNNLCLSHSIHKAKCYLENTKIKCNIFLDHITTYTRISQSFKRELILKYEEGFEEYLVGFNFKILFNDKDLDVKLIPNLPKTYNYTISLRGLTNTEQTLRIEENEITIIQCINDIQVGTRPDLSEVIAHYRSNHPGVTIKYFIIFLTSEVSFANCSSKEEINNFLNSIKALDKAFVFTYVNCNLLEMSKIVTHPREIYVFGLDRRRYIVKMPSNLKMVLDRILFGVFRLEIKKEEYTQLKKLGNKLFLRGNNIYLELVKSKTLKGNMKFFFEYAEFDKEDHSGRDEILEIVSRLKKWHE